MNENGFINIKTTPEDIRGIKRYSELTASTNANGNVSLPKSVDLSRYLPTPGTDLGLQRIWLDYTGFLRG